MKDHTSVVPAHMAQDAVALQAFVRISQAINSALDIRSLLETIMVHAQEVLHCEGASLLLLDPEANELKFYVVVGDRGVRITNMRVPVGTGIAGIAAETKQSIIVNDAANDERIYRKIDKQSNFHTRNLICAPMLVNDQVVGVLQSVNSRDRDEFSEIDLEMLEFMASQSAIAIRNRNLFSKLARSYRQNQVKAEELESINAVMAKASISRNSHDLFDNVLRTVAKNFDAESIYFISLRESLLVTDYAMLRNDPEPGDTTETILYAAIRRSGLLMDISPIIDEPAGGEPYRSAILVPVVAEGTLRGTVAIVERERSQPFYESDCSLASSMCSSFAQAITNLEYHEEHLEKERLDQELATAASIQERILPRTFPHNDHLISHGINLPARTVGGDFYNTMDLGDHFGFVIGDVSGKGVPAAIFMALTRAVLQAEVRHSEDPASILMSANNQLADDSEAGLFATCALTIIHPNQNTILYADAGHGNLLLVRKATREVVRKVERTLPLGAFPNTRYKTRAMNYASGDLLVLYTDGVTEPVNAEDEEFGDDRFYDILLDNLEQTPEQICEAVQQSVQSFCLGMEPFDDLTLMVIKLT